MVIFEKGVGDLSRNIASQLWNDDHVLSNFSKPGEVALPLQLTETPLTDDIFSIGHIKNIFMVFKNAAAGAVSAFKSAVTDKKRLAIIIVLILLWIAIKVFSLLDLESLPLKIISFLTAAEGSLIGGSIAKGMIAALFSRIILDNQLLGTLKSGISTIRVVFKKETVQYAELLFGAAASLVLLNIITHSDIQNLMVPVAAAIFYLAALTHNGFLKKLINALLPKVKENHTTNIIAGCSLAPVVFALISFLPGSKNGYWAALLLIATAVILAIAGRGKKELKA